MTSANHSPASARLEARISPDLKALVQKAADLEGRTLTDFIVTTLQAAAHQAIEKHQTLRLSLEDSEAFAEALLNPPPPNEALTAAALRYQQVMSV